MNELRSPTDESRWEWLCLALIITFAAHALPGWLYSLTWPRLPEVIRKIGSGNFYGLCTLLYGLILTLPAARRSGLRLGSIRSHPLRCLAVCLIPIILTAMIYPHLENRPFVDQPIAMWLISPLAQDLVFLGFLYGKLERPFAGYLHHRLRVRWALVITAAFFAAWHLPNFHSVAAGYVVFQLLYVFFGCILVGLTRQWTGSILYATLTHSAVNFIAWCTS